jgi:flagellar basal body-associated protein FliL
MAALVRKIPPIVPKIGMTALTTLMVVLILAMAYIMFAPNTWPKPFYFSIVNPAQAAGNEAAATDESPASGAESTAAAHTPKTGEAPTEKSPAVTLEIRPGQGLMIDTGTKIVNLMDPTGRRYLRAGIVLEFAPTDLKYYTMTAEQKKTFLETFNEDLKGKLPILNDAIITLLSTQTFDSVYTADGKEKLRREIMDGIARQLPEFQIVYVYFTEFVVQ